MTRALRERSSNTGLRRRPNARKAKAILQRLREMSDRHGGPTKGMTKEQVVAAVKKTREELWDQYLASRPRR